MKRDRTVASGSTIEGGGAMLISPSRVPKTGSGTTGVSELADWESAWGREFVDKPHSTRERIFLPSLLAADNVAVIAAYQNRRIVAGAIANRTGNVVGLSNMFVPTFDEEAVRAACVARVIDAFPGLPIVAYEPRRQLALGPTLDFDVLGPLRVWVRP